MTEETTTTDQAQEEIDLRLIPGVSDRVRAAVTDGFIAIVLCVIAMEIFSAVNQDLPQIRMWTAIFIFGLYDPLLTSFTGATVGHRIMGLRVRDRRDRSRNIGLGFALLRFALKLSLGWISLLLVSKKNNRQAIHDEAARSVVVFSSKKMEEIKRSGK